MGYRMDYEVFMEHLKCPVELPALGIHSPKHSKILQSFQKSQPTYERFCTLVQRCSGCNVVLERRRLPVLPNGDRQSFFVFIGRNPGTQEEENNYPFYPKAPIGKLFKEYLDILGVTRDGSYVSNALFCWTRNNRAPEVLERVTCSYWKGIEFMFLENAKFVFLVGDDAYKQITGNTSSILRIYGQIYTHEQEGFFRYYFPILHPGFVIRNIEEIPIIKAHLEYIRDNYLVPFKKTATKLNYKQWRIENGRTS